MIFQDDGRKYDTLIKKADDTMYQVKKSGRNNYKIFANAAYSYSYIKANNSSEIYSYDKHFDKLASLLEDIEKIIL